MEILIITLLILLNGVFSMSEIALVSSRKFKLQNAAKKGDQNAAKALELADKPNKFLSTVQIGITLIGIFTGVYSGKNLTESFFRMFNAVPLLAPYSESLAVAALVVIVTYFSIVFGELLPKRIGLTYPETIASSVAGPMKALSVIAKPFIWLLANTNDLMLRLFRIRGAGRETITEEEIKSIIAESTSMGEIQEIEQEIVKRVFILGDRRAGELMTHRNDLTCIDIKDDLATIRRKIEADPHAVYPVIDKSPDQLMGTISVNHLFIHNPDPAVFNVTDVLTKPTFVQENMPIYKVLERFREVNSHLLIVVDEFGSVEGALSITDLMIALIGDTSVKVETDFDIVQRNEHSWLADGQYPYYEFVNYFEIPDAEKPEGFTTLAGLVLKNFNHYPSAGEKIRWRNFELEIVDMDERRIDKILITKVS